jgi:hypothetical protein
MRKHLADWYKDLPKNTLNKIFYWALGIFGASILSGFLAAWELSFSRSNILSLLAWKFWGSLVLFVLTGVVLIIMLAAGFFSHRSLNKPKPERTPPPTSAFYFPEQPDAPRREEPPAAAKPRIGSYFKTQSEVQRVGGGSVGRDQSRKTMGNPIGTSDGGPGMPKPPAPTRISAEDKLILMAGANQGYVTVCTKGDDKWIEIGLDEFKPGHPEAVDMVKAFEYLEQRECFDGDHRVANWPDGLSREDEAILVRDSYELSEIGRRRLEQLRGRSGRR